MGARTGPGSAMTTRPEKAAAFLATTKWANSARAPLAGDASNRRYERLTNPDAVLMDAPSNTGEDIRPFIRIAQHLTQHGFSAPQIYAQDTENGFLLLEDLGHDLFTRVIHDNPPIETSLYKAAADVLIRLHSVECPEVTAFDSALMTEQAGLVITSYQHGITGQSDPETLGQFKSQFFDILNEYTQAEPVLILRDYHAENLLWLPDRNGVARVGLLDFQDAVAGHPAYDLVSLLQDIRRTVSPDTITATIKFYIDQTGQNAQQFTDAFTVLGVQRNLRILGVFSRLSLDQNKTQYLDMIPQVWAHVQRGLQHPIMAPLAQILDPILPEPTPENLQHLEPR